MTQKEEDRDAVNVPVEDHSRPKVSSLVGREANNGFWPTTCLHRAAMTEMRCKVCNLLLDRAADAISTNANAVARLEQSVSADRESELPELESLVCDERLKHGMGLTQYELQRSDYGSKTRTVGS